MKITYDSNNSGGSWWLKDDDWFNLEKAGWTIKWYKNEVNSWGGYPSGRFLDALASEAYKEFDSIESAISEWESITGENAEDQGCSCCGQPHNFYDF